MKFICVRKNIDINNGYGTFQGKSLKMPDNVQEINCGIPLPRAIVKKTNSDTYGFVIKENVNLSNQIEGLMLEPQVDRTSDFSTGSNVKSSAEGDLGSSHSSIGEQEEVWYNFIIQKGIDLNFDFNNNTSTVTISGGNDIEYSDIW